MKNITEILKELGIEVPTDKVSDLNKQVAENYKTIVEHEKKVARLELERDNEKERADKADETLKTFDGVDVDKLNSEIKRYKEEAEKAKTEFDAQIAKRDYTDAITKAVEGIKFSSNSAKKAFMAELEADPLKIKNGNLIGFDDFVKSYKETDSEAFVEDTKPKANFTEPVKQQSGNNKTGKQILKGMSLDERIALKNSDPERFASLNK